MGRHIIDYCSLRRTIRDSLMRLPNGRRLPLNISLGVSLLQLSGSIHCCTCVWNRQQFAFLHTALFVDVQIANESDEEGENDNNYGYMWEPVCTRIRMIV